MPEMTLYYKPSCPYCQEVLHFMKNEGIELPLKNIAESAEKRQELMDVGGKAQVPCLIIEAKALYESDDIIEWLKNNYQDEPRKH